MLSRHAINKLVLAASTSTSQEATVCGGAESQNTKSRPKDSLKPNESVSASTTPPQLRWPSVVVESIGECCVEFIHLIVAEANELSRQEQERKAKSKSKSKSESKKRKRETSASFQHNILPSHLFDVLRSLEFEKFIPMAEEAYKRTEADKIEKRERKKKRKKITSTVESEALKAEQKRLFAHAALIFSKER